MLDIIIHGDMHLDLRTEGIDRNNDIMKSMKDILDYAIEVRRKSECVIILNAGDVFHNTRPRSDTIAKAIAYYAEMEKQEIKRTAKSAEELGI